MELKLEIDQKVCSVCGFFCYQDELICPNCNQWFEKASSLSEWELASFLLQFEKKKKHEHFGSIVLGVCINIYLFLYTFLLFYIGGGVFGFQYNDIWFSCLNLHAVLFYCFIYFISKKSLQKKSSFIMRTIVLGSICIAGIISAGLTVSFLAYSQEIYDSYFLGKSLISFSLFTTLYLSSFVASYLLATAIFLVYLTTGGRLSLSERMMRHEHPQKFAQKRVPDFMKGTKGMLIGALLPCAGAAIVLAGFQIYDKIRFEQSLADGGPEDTACLFIEDIQQRDFLSAISMSKKIKPETIESLQQYSQLSRISTSDPQKRQVGEVWRQTIFNPSCTVVFFYSDNTANKVVLLMEQENYRWYVSEVRIVDDSGQRTVAPEDII